MFCSSKLPRHRCFVVAATFAFASSVISTASAQLELPDVFGDHMVLQRDQENPIWGKSKPNTKVTVELGDRKLECQADEQGMWRGKLPVLAAGGPYKIKVSDGEAKLELNDVLAGEVWLCSGQSNMEWNVGSSENFELEKLAANYPQIRMINYPNVGTQETVWSHHQKWMQCNSENLAPFSAVGYFFGRQLYQTLDVPIGLVNDAWGGSAAEAWIDQDVLAQDARFTRMMDRWKSQTDEYEQLSKAENLSEKDSEKMKNLKKQMTSNSRPGNIYHGILESHLGYGIKGAIWYQGESNAGRAYQYRELFPFMISQWREKWNQGDFPFYWVQLADYKNEKSEPAQSDWAELREAQTMTLDKLPHVGEAVIIDLGEGKDIHPRNKVEVGRRLARLALKNDYGYKIAADAPRFESMQIDGKAAILTFKNKGAGWRPFDVNDPVGFTIAGKDQKFYKAEAKILEDNRIRVTANEVEAPDAVRYAWADNPVVNLYSKDDLPLTPFRTDDWPGVTIDNQ